MRQFILISSFISLFLFEAFSQTVINSVKDGNWSDAATWDNGVPQDWQSDQTVYVKHKVTLDKDLSRGNNTLIIEEDGRLTGAYKINIYNDNGKLTNYGYIEITELTGTGIVENYDTIIVTVKADNFWGQHKLYNYTNAYLYVAGDFTDNGNYEENHGIIKIDGDYETDVPVKNYGEIYIGGTALANSNSDIVNYGKIQSQGQFKTNTSVDNEGLLITYGEFYQNSDMLNNGAIYVFGSNDYNLGWGNNLNSTSCGYVNVGCNTFVNNGSVTGKININGNTSGSGTWGPDVTFNPYNNCDNNPVVYISRQSGYWDDAGACSSGDGTWSSKSMYPDPIYEFPHFNGTVIISQGHTVTMRNSGPTNLACDSLVIKPGGALTIESDVTLTVKKDVIIETPQGSGATGSLIDTGTLKIEGQAILHRYITGKHWHFIGSPVDTLILSDFFMDNFYYYDETTADWWDGDNMYGTSGWKHPTANLTDSVMQGYIYYYAEDTLTFVGDSFNTGVLTKVLFYTNNNPDHPEFDGWNLVCNPYPSAIDWDFVNTDNIADNCIYYYDDDGSSPYYNNYRYYIKGGGGSSPYPSTAVNEGSRYIPVAQGFFVRTTTNGAKLRFTNAVRVHQFPDFYKKDQTYHPNLLRLKITLSDKADETVVRFISGSSDNFDGKFDALKMFASNLPQLYSITPKTERLAINTMPNITEQPVYLGFNAPQQGNYSLSATEINFDTNDVYFIDTYTGIILNLKQTPVYEFYSNAGNFEDRFYLKFVPQNKKISEDSDKIIIYAFSHFVKIQQLGIPDNLKIYIFSLDGRLIHSQNSSQNDISIKLYSSGVYIVKIVYSQGILVKKVMVR